MSRQEHALDKRDLTTTSIERCPGVSDSWRFCINCLRASGGGVGAGIASRLPATGLRANPTVVTGTVNVVP